MQQYVLGFCFDDSLSRVVMIRKARPAWQRGLYNGVGGHIEEDESSIDAMVREFREETGQETTAGQWTRFASLHDTVSSGQLPKWAIDVYKMRSTPVVDRVLTGQSPTDEPVVVLSTASLPLHECLANVAWLVPLARDWREGKSPVHIDAVYPAGSQ